MATANAGSTSYIAGGLQANTTYTYRIRAFNSIGDSTYSNSASATTASLAPVLDFSNGFAASTNLLTYNGSAAISGTLAQLTNGAINEAGSFFSNSPVIVTEFSTLFSFQLLNGGRSARTGLPGPDVVLHDTTIVPRDASGGHGAWVSSRMGVESEAAWAMPASLPAWR